MAQKNEKKYPHPWGPITIPDDGLKLPLPENRSLLLRLEGSQLQHLFVTASDTVNSSLYDVTILNGTGELIFQPRLPDLSVVLRTDQDLRILPSGLMKTRVSVPLTPCITLKTEKKGLQTVLEIPIDSMSKTWLGDTVSGEAAYALHTPFHPNGIAEGPSPWVSLCPLTIINASPEPLQFKRMILRVPYLSLYAGENRIYSNELRARFKGQDQNCQFQISTEPPSVDEAVLKICGPRRSKDKELIGKGFTFFRSLYSYKVGS